MRGRRALFFFLLLMVAVVGFILLLPSIVIGNLVDHVLYGYTTVSWIEQILSITPNTGVASMLIRYVLGIVVITLFSTGLRYVVHYLLHKISMRTVEKLRVALYEKLQTLSADFYAHTPSGELIANLTSDVALLKI